MDQTCPKLKYDYFQLQSYKKLRSIWLAQQHNIHIQTVSLRKQSDKLINRILTENIIIVGSFVLAYDFSRLQLKR
jgi:hypothetical protein